MTVRRPIFVALILSIVILPARVDAQVRLTGWADEPALLPRGGAAVELFRLSAGARWEPGAREAVAPSIRVVGPGGQSSTRRLDPAEVGSSRLSVYVPTAWVRNLRPESVAIEVSLVDPASGRVVSGPLRGGVEAFPGPKTSSAPADPGPFGWGRSLDGPPGTARPMLRSGPDGWRFVRVPATPDRPGYNIATSEASTRQIKLRLPGYDPRAGRSDDFLLDDPNQPSVGLTPAACLTYLAALHAADADGPRFRLPTRAEWLHAARAGRASSFWWGDAPTHPDANLLGREPALADDTTAPTLPAATVPSFHANPWGLFHAVGNVEEWATDPSGGFVRLGGHFRTEASPTLSETHVTKPTDPGPDAFVGLRPAFDLSAEEAAGAIRRALAKDPRLKAVTASFDPDSASCTLGGTAADPGDRQVADARVASLWWVEAVDNRIATPKFAPGALVRLGAVAGPVRQVSPLGRTHYEIPVAVTWADRLPVAGSEYWVNVYPAYGGAESHRLIEGDPGTSGRVTVVVDRSRAPGPDAQVSAALSLGGPAALPDDPKIVSNVAVLRWKGR